MTKEDFEEFYGEDPEALGPNWETIIRGLEPGDDIPGYPPSEKEY